MHEALMVALYVQFCLEGVLLRYAPFHNMLPDKKKKELFACYGLFFAVCALVCYVALKEAGITLSVAKIAYFTVPVLLTLINILFIPGRIREHLFVYGTVALCNYTMSALPTFLVSYLSDLDPVQSLFAVMLGQSLLQWCCFPFFRKLIINSVEPLLSITSGQYWGVIWVIPVILFAGEVMMYPGTLHLTNVGQLLSRGLTGVATVLLCFCLARDQQKLRERQIMLEQLADQRAHYSQIKAQVESARRERHDFRHHLMAIQHYIDADDKEGLRQYCDALYDRAVTEEPLPDTGNPAADAVVHRYMQLSRQHNVRFEYNGIIPTNCMKEVDLCVLLGNALENAMAGCLTVPDNRRILVAARRESQVLSLMVKNTFDGVVEQKQAAILSRKRKDRPGVGMSSMRSVCDSYGAQMQTSWDERSFTVLFLIPVNN